MLAKNKVRIIFLLVLIIVSLAAGCGKKPTKKPVSPPKLVGVSVTFQDKDLKDQVKKSMEENAKQDGLKIVWKDSKPDKQEEDVKKLLDRKVKVLIVQFADESGAQAITRAAKTKGVPILALGTMPKNVPLDGFIGIDAYRSGLQQGEFLASSLKDMKLAQVLILKGIGSSAEDAMVQGNLEGLKRTPAIKSKILEILPKESVSAKLAALKELDTYQGIISHNPSWTEEAVGLLADLKLDRSVITVGIGATKQNVKAIINGTHEAEVDLDPILLGKYAYIGAKELAKEGQWQFEKQETSGSYDIPVKYLPANLITKENTYLVENRFKDLLGEQKQMSKETNKSSQENKQSGENPKQGAKKTKVKIQTKEGKTMEIEVEGEVLKVEVQGPQSQGGEQK